MQVKSLRSSHPLVAKEAMAGAVWKSGVQQWAFHGRINGGGLTAHSGMSIKLWALVEERAKARTETMVGVRIIAAVWWREFVSYRRRGQDWMGEEVEIA